MTGSTISLDFKLMEPIDIEWSVTEIQLQT